MKLSGAPTVGKGSYATNTSPASAYLTPIEDAIPMTSRVVVPGEPSSPRENFDPIAVPSGQNRLANAWSTTTAPSKLTSARHASAQETDARRLEVTPNRWPRRQSELDLRPFLLLGARDPEIGKLRLIDRQEATRTGDQ